MPADALESLTSALGLPEANGSVDIVGGDPVLQTNFRVGEASAAALAAIARLPHSDNACRNVLFLEHPTPANSPPLGFVARRDPAAKHTRQGFLSLEEAQRQHILDALERTGWLVSGERGAAKLLGIKPTTLESGMKKLGIRRKP